MGHLTSLQGMMHTKQRIINEKTSTKNERPPSEKPGTSFRKKPVKATTLVVPTIPVIETAIYEVIQKKLNMLATRQCFRLKRQQLRPQRNKKSK
jgi:hypothetical protein